MMAAGSTRNGKARLGAERRLDWEPPGIGEHVNRDVHLSSRTAHIMNLVIFYIGGMLMNAHHGTVDHLENHASVNKGSLYFCNRSTVFRGRWAKAI